MNEEQGIFEFIKDAIGKTGIKATFGYGLKIDKFKLVPTPYLKIKLMGSPKIDFSTFINSAQDAGFLTGIKIKKTSMKIDLGICTSLKEEISLKNIKPAFFMGFSLPF